ncbi:developmentally regulated GTP-binding protein [Ordospora colligata]|uniref:Developmentally regulated GTP-binding protein n=1 Tax=Ordospora colligata OC4 TaxID=1354746 RepID=A0A0B2UDR9_9MICR|nr:developmentally regulated GTP-binding protein [Ordospora colligata OC4]KHN69201.1 developmentally regulated GTP-binding protein [Ordospora colligata OC4]TBU14479.1 developmentally regulated GTP-binding protein [Ordospora colligata]TBU14656.1 developmentally regulated GTP-binding protein [Ordospora colligata]TBU18041.1 developmentally regulated GTP-binding protein [Ordospora colligata]
MGIQDKINEIESEMARTQKNKKTEHHLGILKARLAKYRQELDAPKMKQSRGDDFEVCKSGDARVALIGFPSVGKSTLLSRITSTHSKAAEHEFTTLSCISGKMRLNDTWIQVLDLPGIISGASQNKGRGKQVIGVARTADMILMMLDPRRSDDKKVLEHELYEMGIRLNKKRPDISITPTSSSGISIGITCELTRTTEDVIKGILREYKINNCQMLIKEDVSEDDVIDVLSGSVVYIDCLYVYNKIDELSLTDFNKIAGQPNSTVISCRKDWNIDGLMEDIWSKLDLLRVYTKKKGMFPSMDDPVVIKRGRTIKDLCIHIHKDFLQGFKHALVWGISAKHIPQRVGLGHLLEDEDVIQIFLK